MKLFTRLKRLALPLIVATSLGMVLIPAQPSWAAYDLFHGANGSTNACAGRGGDSSVCKQNGSDPITGPNGIIIKATKIIAVISGITAVIIMMVGGFMYILSNGDAGKIKEAKSAITYAAVGLVVIVMAQSIIIFVVNRL